MPTDSPFPSIDIPNVDIWGFLFERKDRKFPGDKGESLNKASNRQDIDMTR